MLRNFLSTHLILLLFVLSQPSQTLGNVSNVQLRQNFRFHIPRPELSNRNVRRESEAASEETLTSSTSSELGATAEEIDHESHARRQTEVTTGSVQPRRHHPNAIVRDPVQDCPGCRRLQRIRHSDQEELSPEALRNLRLTKIKEKIMKKLRLKEPPKVSEPKPLPDTFLAATYHNNRQSTHTSFNDVDDYYGKTEQVIVFAEEGNGAGNSVCQLRRSIPSACLSFVLPQEVAKEKADLRATSAELWVYAFEEDPSIDRVFTIAQVSTNEEYHGPKLTSLDPRHSPNSTDGWEAMNVSTTVGVWMNKTLHFRTDRDYPPLTLQIGCRNCTKVSIGSTSPIDISNPQHRPFLVINMAERMQKSRRRRNIDCHSSSGPVECCRESFRVSFTEIGWGWILHPEEFDAYYCRGRCGGMRSAHHHTSAMQAQINVQNRTATMAEAQALIPCCTPKKMSGITIMVSLTNNTSERKDLPNMVVESCGCAGEEEIS